MATENLTKINSKFEIPNPKSEIDFQDYQDLLIQLTPVRVSRYGCKDCGDSDRG